uniref:PCI domain-containing protein n=1 Tax=Erythrolobus australicus TaxID=1077150 RepID=A0A7S1XIQ6_9RHOD
MEAKGAVDTLKRELSERSALHWMQLASAQLDCELMSEAEVAEMRRAIEDELKKLDAKVTDAEENLGESEVRDALEKRLDFFLRIGDREQAVAAYERTLAATVGVGQKLDLVLHMIRFGLALRDFAFTSKYITIAKEMVEKGGDWERRNRLRVYEATHLMAVRQFKPASALFLEALATFSASELFDYKQFVRYTVLICMHTVDRPTLKEKVSNAPEVLSVILEMPTMRAFVEALVKCDYRTYMAQLPDVLQAVSKEYYLSTHTMFIGRELRVAAYSQFLASYLSVKLEAMGVAFGVGSEFLDAELTRFIAAGRLSCKIDKVNGVVETARPEARHSIYESTIKQGDILLNRVQKLSRVIDI